MYGLSKYALSLSGTTIVFIVSGFVLELILNYAKLPVSVDVF